MAEENDQNAVQPQNDEQQTVPMPQSTNLYSMNC